MSHSRRLQQSKSLARVDAIFTIDWVHGYNFVNRSAFFGLPGREIGKGPEDPAVATNYSEPEREAVFGMSRFAYAVVSFM